MLLGIGAPASTGATIAGDMATSLPPPPAPTIVRTAGTSFVVDEFYVHVPAGVVQPMRVLLAFHGMGGSGQEEADAVAPLAEGHGWVTIAPTYAYGDWSNPAQVAEEESKHLPRIVALLDTLPDLLGGSIEKRALLYGFSRGAQTAERLAIAFPDRVAGAALLSGGTYTVPQIEDRDGISPLRYPFGVADQPSVMGHKFDPSQLSRVPFWIGVGALDTDSEAVPRAWDPYLGDNRVQRAQRLADCLGAAGAPAQVQLFAGIGHEQSAAVTGAALEFLAQVP
ncbi:MAG TPA: hypothetical protein VGK54_05640 [Chloroflexota bacterium]